MTDSADLTRFQYDLLAVIAAAEDGADGDQNGLALKADLEAHYGVEVNHGRLYPNLDDLVERGLVAKRQVDRRTNGYTLTQQGVDRLADRFQFLHDSVTEAFVIEHGDGDITFRKR